MKYQPPWGTSDPNGAYINGNPALGQQGSIPPAAAFEQPQREIVGVIEKSGFVTSDIDLLQLSRGIRSQRLNYAVDTGTPNNIVATFDPPFTPGVNPYTLGLELHVRVRFTNALLGDGTGRTSINAGAGNVPIRRMNSDVLSPGDLPQGAIATLVYDGTGFQLSNFGGGAGGDVTYESVNIPFGDDQSTTAGTIIPIFLTPLTSALTAGDILAVQVANTAPGATVMRIDIGGTPTEYNLLPNGGGIMLQGDIAAGDVVQFFFDGVALRFAPNPEITAEVSYTIGQGQMFDTVALAMAAIRRKTIGASGFVTLQMVAGGGSGPNGVYPGPISVSHPSGDRIAVRGTLIGNNRPSSSTFQVTGNSAGARATDSAANIALMRAVYYGTEIVIPPVGFGVSNAGPGVVRFQDLLITGAQLALPPVGWNQTGVSIDPGFAASLDNVTVWGSQVGYNNRGTMYATSCFASANMHSGFGGGGSGLWANNCGSFGNANFGFGITFATGWLQSCTSRGNGGVGLYCDNGSGIASWWGTALQNGTDVTAQIGATITFITEPDAQGNPIPGFVTCSPPPNTVGNLNSMVATVAIASS
jgi:hypothetical protein